MAEVFGDQARVAGRLAKPGRGGVAQGVGGDALLDPSALRRASDDPGEDRGLQAPAAQAAEDRCLGPRLGFLAQSAELARSAGASGWRRGFPPLPERTTSDGWGPSRSTSPQSSAISSERRSPVKTSATSTRRSRSASPRWRRAGAPAASRSRSNSAGVNPIGHLPRL